MKHICGALSIPRRCGRGYPSIRPSTIRFADSDVPIRLRIGINAGEPIAEDDDLHGASVVIAKRLESAAETNGILVSEGTNRGVRRASIY
jgi:class 3 adenylate cyclase